MSSKKVNLGTNIAHFGKQFCTLYSELIGAAEHNGFEKDQGSNESARRAQRVFDNAQTDFINHLSSMLQDAPKTGIHAYLPYPFFEAGTLEIWYANNNLHEEIEKDGYRTGVNWPARHLDAYVKVAAINGRGLFNNKDEVRIPNLPATFSVFQWDSLEVSDLVMVDEYFKSLGLSRTQMSVGDIFVWDDTLLGVNQTGITKLPIQFLKKPTKKRIVKRKVGV